MKKNKCENCGVDFERHYIRRFCSKACWHKFNARNLASFNEKRFQWKNCSEQEKLDRIKIRFEEKVIKKDGCWEWKGFFDKDGYPLLSSGANGKGFKERRAHRISWLIKYGEIPNDKLVCHKCDNPSCTNPEHLFLGSILENNRDKVSKGRGNNGSKHGNSKLTEDQVKEMRLKFRDGVMIKTIMEEYSICRQSAHLIKYCKTWKHVRI